VYVGHLIPYRLLIANMRLSGGDWMKAAGMLLAALMTMGAVGLNAQDELAGRAGSVGPSGSDGMAGQQPGRGFGGPGGSLRGTGMGMLGVGRNVAGTLRELTLDHAVVHSYLGPDYRVNFTAATRFFHQQSMGQIQEQGQGQGQDAGQIRGSGRGRRGEGGMRGPAGSEIKATDLKVGDPVEVQGAVDAVQKTVAAQAVVVMNPERARQLAARLESWAKTWLSGKVVALDGVRLTVQGTVDNLPHVVLADENTSFRKRRDPVTLADVAVGDELLVQGAGKAEVFVASSINIMGFAPGGSGLQREGQSPPPPLSPVQTPEK